MAKNKTKTPHTSFIEAVSAYNAKAKEIAIKNADSNFLCEILLKHIFCDNPSPTAGEDACREVRVRVKELLVHNALKRRDA